MSTEFDSQFESYYKDKPVDVNFGNVTVHLKYNEEQNTFDNDEACLSEIEKFQFVMKSRRVGNDITGFYALELAIEPENLKELDQIRKLTCVDQVFEL